MRLVILSVFVVCCAAAYGQAFGPNSGKQEVPESKWGEVTGKVQPFLDQLASEQSHNFKLIKFVKVEFQSSPGGDVYSGDAEFENNGEKLTCGWTLGFSQSTGIGNFGINCGEKFYNVQKQQ